MGHIYVSPLFDEIHFLTSPASSFVDAGDPNNIYNDPFDQSNPGFALFPVLGNLTNDIGAYGGPPLYCQVLKMRFWFSLNPYNSIILFFWVKVLQRPGILLT
jgi:hypothetical protein